MKYFLLILLLFVCENVLARMQPAENIFPKDINDARIALNKRPGFEDCHLRYHKYGEFYLEYPVFGTPAKRREFAHMAAIGWTLPDGNIDYHCGGSLIAPNYVVTAGHCTSRESVAPDTVRLGDINLYSEEDDEFVQVFKIAEVVKHPEYKFSSSYNDIALLRLQGAVKVNDNVAPSCLWTEKIVDFAKLEATGWGYTGYAAKKTDVLLKVVLNQFTNTECNNFYNIDSKLDKGIVDSQICYGDTQMDTCPGDSGGPLQIKLLSNERLTPFLVGLTSFGAACGYGQPGVYTRMSHYMDWIESVTLLSFNITECALRDMEYREFSKDLVANQMGEYTFIEPERGHIDVETSVKHRAFIGFSNGGETEWKCAGSLITENYILTAASCLGESVPEAVKIGALNEKKDGPDVQQFKIIKSTIHPGYKAPSHQNDIALIQLDKDVRITKNTVPSCLWMEKSTQSPAFEVGGSGPGRLNAYAIKKKNAEATDSIYLRVRVNTVDNENCTNSLGGEKITETQFCAGNSLNLIPGTCELKHGGSVERETWHYDKYFPYIYGVNSFGSDCGYGKPAVFTKVAEFVPWIESVVYNELVSDGSPASEPSGIIFVADDLQLGDVCRTQNMDGVCTKQENCPKLVELFKQKRQKVDFCAMSSEILFCCPTSFVVRETTEDYSVGQRVAGDTAFETCDADFSYLRRSSEAESKAYYPPPSEGRFALTEEVPHAVGIGWTLSDGKVDWKCAGAFITQGYILTSASCLKSNAIMPNILRMGNVTYLESASDYTDFAQGFVVSNVITHPKYNFKTHANDIALVEYYGEASFSKFVTPACLWMDKVNTPFNLRAFGLEKFEKKQTKLHIRPRSPIFNEDCKKLYNGETILDQHMCVENFYTTNDVCLDKSGDILQTTVERNSTSTPFLVGVKSYGKNCKAEPVVYTKIAHHVDWIKSIIFAD